MPERNRLREVLVQTECARDGTGDLRHFEGMREAGAEMVALGGQEHLRLMR